MFFISITNIKLHEARSLKYLTGMKCFYDERFKKFEFVGSKAKHFKFVKLFKTFADIKKGEVWDWTSTKETMRESYKEIK